METVNVINQLQPQEVEDLLIGKGVEPGIAAEFSAYFEAQGSIENVDELTTKLQEFGASDAVIQSVILPTKEGISGTVIGVTLPGDGSVSGTTTTIDETFLDEQNYEDGRWFYEEEDGFPGEPVNFPGEPPALPENNRPLVFIPGIMASELMDKNTGTKVWPPFGPDGFEEGLTTIKSLAQRIQNGGYRTLEPARSMTLNPYTGLLHFLDKKCSYSVDRRNLLIFTYNWMQSNMETAVQFKAAIEQFLKDFNEEFGTSFDKVDVICHSMGGLVTRAAIKLNDAPINKTVYICTPHYGAPKAYFILNPEIDFFGFIAELAFDLFGPKGDFDDLNEAFQVLGSACPSVFELLPDAYYLSAIGVIDIPPAKEREDYKNERIKGYIRTYFDENEPWYIKNEDLRKEFMKAMAFKFKLGEEIPGDHLSLYADRVKTLDTVVYTFRFTMPYASGETGDGTVPRYSGSGGGSANSASLYKALTHNQAPNDQRTLERIDNFLKLRQFV